MEFSADIKAIGDQIAGLKISQAVELAKYLEDVHQIKPAAGGAVMAMPAAGPAVAEKPAEKTEFTVVLEGFDPAKKIQVIKVVREIASLGLAEAKAFVEGAPKNVKENVSKEDADKVKEKIESAGGKVAIK